MAQRYNKTKIAILSMLGAAILSSDAETQGRASRGKIDILGCWQEVIPAPPEDNRTMYRRLGPKLQLCFYEGGDLVVYSIESGRQGRYFSHTWRFRGRSILRIHRESCTIKYADDNWRFNLANCAYEGDYLFECRSKHPGFGCSAPDAVAQSQTPNTRTNILGCWQKVIPPTRPDVVLGPFTPELKFCFHKNGTISGFYLESEGLAGDLQKTWRYHKPSFLLIDDEFCRFSPEPNDRRFTLSNCLYEAEWRFECHLARGEARCRAK